MEMSIHEIQPQQEEEVLLRSNQNSWNGQFEHLNSLESPESNHLLSLIGLHIKETNLYKLSHDFFDNLIWNLLPK